MLGEWLEYLENQVGHGVYLWGGQGKHVEDVADVRRYIYNKAQDDERAARVWKFYQTLSKVESDIRFFDCSGLAMYFFQNLHGITKSDTTAHGLWGGCTALKMSELRPGDFVFKKSGGETTHIGYVALDGDIIEARGSGHGVVKRPIDAGEWTHYGRHKWLKAEIEGGAGATVAKKETVEETEAKRTVKQWQNLLLLWDSKCLPKYGADGDYGKETDAAVCALIKALQALRKESGYE
jgi:hypothetical protein